MLKTHSVRASQTCLQTNKQTDNFGRLTYLQSSQEDSQVTNSTDQQTCDPQRGFASNKLNKPTDCRNSEGIRQ